jgi:mannose PTS system EIIA component
MPGLIIIAHAPLASSLQAVARHVFPDCGAALTALDVAPNASPEAVETQLRQLVGAAGQEDVLILADVFGATPCNAALAVADGLHVRVVAGVNVPMLWRTLCYQSLPLDELVNRAVAGAAQGAMHVSVPRRQNQPPGPASSNPAHDQVQHHHQQ